MFGISTKWFRVTLIWSVSFQYNSVLHDRGPRFTIGSTTFTVSTEVSRDFPHSLRENAVDSSVLN